MHAVSTRACSADLFIVDAVPTAAGARAITTRLTSRVRVSVLFLGAVDYNRRDLLRDLTGARLGSHASGKL